MELFKELLYVVITVMLPIVVKFGADYIKQKTSSAKYSKAIECIIDSVEYVNQVMVDSIKKEGKFTEEAQKEALNLGIETALNLMDDELKKYIEKNYGDLNTWVETQIESTIQKLKKELTIK